MFNKIIKDICQELNIKYTYLSKEWLIKLEKDHKIKYLAQNKFDLNGHVIGKIMDDKYALYEVLKDLNIPVIKYNIFYKEDNDNEYAKGCNTEASMIKCFEKYHHDIVIKPNNGFNGNNVYHINNKEALLKISKLILKNSPSLDICPFYNIKYEYRVIVLANEVKLLFKKINPRVIGNGISTLKELLLSFNEDYFKDKDIPNIIPKKDEEYTYDFQFNLSKGSIASLDINDELKEKVTKLALEVTKKTGIVFASIDIIELYNGSLLVLEANSGVTINKVIKYLPNGYNIAKEIYKEAIIKLFE